MQLITFRLFSMNVAFGFGMTPNSIMIMKGMRQRYSHGEQKAQGQDQGNALLFHKKIKYFAKIQNIYWILRQNKIPY